VVIGTDCTITTTPYKIYNSRAEDEGIGIYVVGIGVNDRTELDETSSHPLTTFQYLVGDEKELKDIPIKIQAAVLGCKYYLFI
jgi:hypothetical protein